MRSDLVLIDTSAWIRLLRRNPPPALASRVKHTVLEHQAATTGIIILELLGGVRTDDDYDALCEDLRALALLSSDDVWPQAWRLSFLLRRRGVTVPSADVLVAAVAIHHGCRLLHADTHFGLIARHSSLRQEAV